MRAVQERSGIRRAIAGQDRSQSERLVRAAMYLALCLLAAVGMGCGDDSGDDDGGSADGGGSADCLMRILPIDSDTLVQGQSITLSGAIEYGSGFEEYQWYVSHEDAVITADSAEPSVTFVAELAGVYQIVLDGSKGIQCDSDQLSLNVEASNARQQRYRLRAIPDSTLRAAPTERELTVVGGANNYWGALVLRGDDSLSGTVRDSDGAILPAFVRVQTEAGQVVGEAVTDGAGRFEIFAEADAYELVVIPADNLTAPRSFQVTAPADDAYIIDRGEPVSGVVRDGAGNPLSGARVSVNMDDLPSTLASTDDSGAFTVYARPTTGAALAVVVTPPADSGLPVAELAGEAGLQFGNEALVIEYSAALSTRAVSLPVHSSDGSPAPAMTRAIWTAEPITGAATVRVGPVSAPAMGRVLLSAEVGTDGATDEIHLPAGLYTVVVEPPSSSDDSGSAAVH
ncbi:MAG: carboxypeptidase-like regulatory domain-containing protein, partial [Myxococcota bacterium]